MFVIVIVIVVTRTMVNIIFTYVIAYFQDWNNTLFAQSMPLPLHSNLQVISGTPRSVRSLLI